MEIDTRTFGRCAFQLVLGVLLIFGRSRGLAASVPVPAAATASSAQPDGAASGAADGDRFSAGPGHSWRGMRGATHWDWTLDFGHVTRIGSLLQVVGSHDFVLRDAPRDYWWESSRDGRHWVELPGTRIVNERHLYRILRLTHPVRARWLRLRITSAHGEFPCVREVEVRERTDAGFSFPEWVLAVNMTHDGVLPGHGHEFLPLARSVRAELQAQQVWLTDFDPEFVAVEPRPLAAFLSGTFKDWCEVDRTHWRGTERVLNGGRLPMWASCGGAQGLALLSEYGTEQPWDCPHCRVEKAGVMPLYTHIGHFAFQPCGDYSGCVFERGPHRVRQLGDDPVFRALPEEFVVMESHCGQIERAPTGWEITATAGAGTLTRTQCLRRKDRPIYAAQFHIEMAGTPEVSRSIMAAFLEEAGKWQIGDWRSGFGDRAQY